MIMNYSSVTSFLATLVCGSLLLMRGGVHAHTNVFCVTPYRTDPGYITVYAGHNHDWDVPVQGGLIIAGGYPGDQQFGTICAQPYSNDYSITKDQIDEGNHEWLCGKRINFDPSISLNFTQLPGDVNCFGFSGYSANDQHYFGVNIQVEYCGGVGYWLSTTDDSSNKIERPRENLWQTFGCQGVASAVTADTSNQCSFKRFLNYIQQIAPHVDGLTPLYHEKIQCNYPSVCYLTPSAVQSLHKILELEPEGARLRIETAYFGPVEQYLINLWNQNGSDGPCSNRELKNFIEDPIPIQHSTGCAFDIDPTNLGRWKDILISKGWEYTRPTIDKHHFEYLKCRDEVSASAGITAFQTLWNIANPLKAPLSGGAWDSETIAAIGGLVANQGFNLA